MIRNRNMIGYALFVAFVATVLGANWSLAEFGVVQIGFGLAAPAGVFFAGVAFTFRHVEIQAVLL